MLSLSDWFTALTLVFGGCCSNAITTERLTSAHPHSGILITFFQFFIVSLYALPSQLTLTAPIPNRTAWLPALRKRRVPLPPYLVQVALFFVLSTLNNAAFAYHIPMTVHIVFRSGGMIVNMLFGSLFLHKRYTFRQVLSVFIVTIGIILTTVSASKPRPTASDTHQTDVSLYAQGISILSLALLLSGFLGLTQDYVFAQYIKPTSASDPLAPPSWQESMFYNHSLALPLFFFSREYIASELSQLGTSPPVSFSPLPLMDAYLPKATVPSMSLYLLANTITQLFCVIGVNRLTGRVSSLTVTLILTVRKAVSLLLSVVVYGGQTNPVMWIGATLVFIGTTGYSTRGRSGAKDKKD